MGSSAPKNFLKAKEGDAFASYLSGINNVNELYTAAETQDAEAQILRNQNQAALGAAELSINRIGTQYALQLSGLQDQLLKTIGKVRANYGYSGTSLQSSSAVAVQRDLLSQAQKQMAYQRQDMAIQKQQVYLDTITGVQTKESQARINEYQGRQYRVRAQNALLAAQLRLASDRQDGQGYIKIDGL